jgi:hypothetical protein
MSDIRLYVGNDVLLKLGDSDVKLEKIRALRIFDGEQLGPRNPYSPVF